MPRLLSDVSSMKANAHWTNIYFPSIENVNPQLPQLKQWHEHLMTIVQPLYQAHTSGWAVDHLMNI